MRQAKYLFIGGPFDQQWRRAGSGDPVPVVSAVAATRPGQEVTGQIVNYFRQVVEVPGAWAVPLTIYTTDPLLRPEPGTPMPGWLEGMRPAVSPVGPWRWIDQYPGEAARVLREAVQRENRRRLAR